MIRPHVLLSVAVSVDGYIDDRGAERFPLSNAEDFDHVDRVRAESDAILVGAATIRRDNPRLLVNSAERRAARVAAGRPEHPVKVTVTGSGDLDPTLKFWHHGGDKVVYTTDAGHAPARAAVGELADVVPIGPAIDFGALLDDLGARGVDRLMVEGGGLIHTAFLTAGLADEIRMAVAPMLIGQATAPRFVNPAEFPGGPARRFHLEEVAKLGDVAVLRYFPKA
ncbi:5-amino-6-(5-phosphoribosylamino)uracil reductase [Saccharothrix ecbatanensis]|uniref:5-amino-6-(5-phosphoribosylamino)uracil reductase n=1 Tax=Saccharothrix ecbatanensis TaxID=1105145 RepID=A0A7W9HTR6_9PSEU|nr:dihydrofolate reductase family protein [Saccharothrix ecbatanensis]MBB5807996.1 5-amino-6-(5-phosphoribosylamino)uracil reductase [Saccharothrix ecbatanensis]